jgi:hypothetical protein
VVFGAQHAGVEQVHAAIEAAADPAIFRGSVTLDDASDAEHAQRGFQVIGLGERITKCLAAVPHRGVACEELLLQLCQHFRFRFGALGREHCGPLVEGWRTHDFELLLECCPRIHVLGEEREHLLIGA